MNEPSTRETAQVAGELGRRVAAAGALVVALVSLLQHAPLWLACVRGAGTLAVLVLGTHLGTAALTRAVEADRAKTRARKGAGS